MSDSLGVQEYWSWIDYVGLMHDKKEAKRESRGFFDRLQDRPVEQQSKQKKRKKRRMASKSRVRNRGGNPTTGR